jgi:hypothetical protein
MYLLQLTQVVKLRTWLAKERVPWASIPHPTLPSASVFALWLLTQFAASTYDIY